MYLLSGRKRTVTKLTKKDKSETKNRMFRYENPNRSHSHILFLIFFITIIHKTASLPIRIFYFEVYFQSTFKIKKSIDKKHIHIKAIWEKASVGQIFLQGSHLKKTTQSKKSKLSGSHNMPNPVGWVNFMTCL